jgi:hypothetical protein
MGLSETLVFYLVIGLAVAVAWWSQAEESSPGARIFCAATAFVFWPMYLPALLTPAQAQAPLNRPPTSAQADELSTMIAGVDRELATALDSLDGWGAEVLSRERVRIADLRSAWEAQAERIREMDAVLNGSVPLGQLADPPQAASERIRQSEQARQDNLVRLRQVRDSAYGDLAGTLTRVRELISQIYLAKFTGAPSSRGDELVLEIAESVESMSEVAAWSDHCVATNVPGQIGIVGDTLAGAISSRGQASSASSLADSVS